MENQYYYLVSSLPSLFLHETPPIRKDDFLAICKRYVTKSDFVLLESVTLFDSRENETPSVALRSFYNFEYRLRNALSRLRSQKLNINRDEFVRNDMPDDLSMPLAEEAFHAASPLMAEEILNKARWRYLDDLEFGHYFDSEKVVIFFIKLQILERIYLFNTQRGREKLDALVDLKQVQKHYFQTLSTEESDRNIHL